MNLTSFDHSPGVSSSVIIISEQLIIEISMCCHCHNVYYVICSVYIVLSHPLFFSYINVTFLLCSNLLVKNSGNVW